MAEPPVIWSPNPGPQTDLITCPFDEIFYGGAKGGGKSDGMLGDWLAHLAKNPVHARGIIFRKTYPSLEQLIQRSKELFFYVGGVWKEQKKTWLFPGGATLKFRFVETTKDAAFYQGHEYTWMAFDEVGEIATAEVVNILRGALRNTKGVKSRLVLSGNPMGEGHEWLLLRFMGPDTAPIDPYEPQTEESTTAGKTVRWTRVFIPSKLEDNPKLFLSDPTYELRLQQMTHGKPWLYRALRFGDWRVKPEVPGALLTNVVFDRNRVDPFMANRLGLTSLGLAIDPSGSGNPAADECGLIVMGGTASRHKYTLEDASCGGGPKVWAPKAARLVKKWKLNWVVAESNFGGEMVSEVLEVHQLGLKVELIQVSRGKHIRAEPAALEHEEGYVHHVGIFKQLQSEWTTWVPDGKHRSPNRLDAEVFAIHRLGGAPGLNIRDL